MVTAPGLFSVGGPDDGTRLLAETAAIGDGERVLDLCCGYGLLGVYAGRVADCELWLTDDDCRAAACARQSLDRADAARTVVTADGTAGVDDRIFDTVLGSVCRRRACTREGRAMLARPPPLARSRRLPVGLRDGRPGGDWRTTRDRDGDSLARLACGEEWERRENRGLSRRDLNGHGTDPWDGDLPGRLARPPDQRGECDLRDFGPEGGDGQHCERRQGIARDDEEGNQHEGVTDQRRERRVGRRSIAIGSCTEM